MKNIYQGSVKKESEVTTDLVSDDEEGQRSPIWSKKVIKHRIKIEVLDRKKLKKTQGRKYFII